MLGTLTSLFVYRKNEVNSHHKVLNGKWPIADRYIPHFIVHKLIPGKHLIIAAACSHSTTMLKHSTSYSDVLQLMLC